MMKYFSLFSGIHFLSLEREKGSLTRGELYFLKSQGFSQTNNPNTFFSKMYMAYYLTKMETLSRESLGFSPNWGMTVNGNVLIAKTLDCPKTEKECSLKDILERNVPEKYYLKKEIAERLLHR